MIGRGRRVAIAADAISGGRRRLRGLLAASASIRLGILSIIANAAGDDNQIPGNGGLGRVSVFADQDNDYVRAFLGNFDGVLSINLRTGAGCSRGRGTTDVARPERSRRRIAASGCRRIPMAEGACQLLFFRLGL